MRKKPTNKQIINHYSIAVRAETPSKITVKKYITPVDFPDLNNPIPFFSEHSTNWLNTENYDKCLISKNWKLSNVRLKVTVNYKGWDLKDFVQLKTLYSLNFSYFKMILRAKSASKWYLWTSTEYRVQSTKDK